MPNLMTHVKTKPTENHDLKIACICRVFCVQSVAWCGTTNCVKVCRKNLYDASRRDTFSSIKLRDTAHFSSLPKILPREPPYWFSQSSSTKMHFGPDRTTLYDAQKGLCVLGSLFYVRNSTCKRSAEFSVCLFFPSGMMVHLTRKNYAGVRV